MRIKKTSSNYCLYLNSKCLFKTHQRINNGMSDEEPTVMEMLIQSKDARSSQGKEAKEKLYFIQKRKLYFIQSPTPI